MSENAVQKVNYSHDAMIDMIIANPGVSQGRLAHHFGYTQAWVSRVMSSDAFKARLAERRKEIIDPIVSQSVEERFTAVLEKGLDNLHEALVKRPDDTDLAITSIEVASKAMGFGAKVAQGPAVQANFVVALPPASKSVEDWQAQHAPQATIVENQK